MLKRSKREDCWTIPTGLLPDVSELVEGWEIVDKRRRPKGRIELDWVGPELRDYQLKAIEEAVKDRGLHSCRGMLKLPIRSGKTMIAAGLIRRLGVRTVFVVPSEMLLNQTAEAFRAALEPAPIGVFGGGNHDTDWITIATVQSLLTYPDVATKLLAECDLLIIDEAHHLEGEAWRRLILKSEAPFKIGLSATIFVSGKRKNEQSSIWLKACTGPILYNVSMQRLIDAGHVIRPRIMFYRYVHQNPMKGRSWQRVVKEALALNPTRNRLICDLAEAAVYKGKRVLIDTGRKDQMKALKSDLAHRNIRVEVVHGGTPSEARRARVAELKAGRLQVIIGTVFGEGVDIPELEVVINAEAQKSPKATIQRMRNLTPSEGKTEQDVMFIDIADIGQKHLQKHALARFELYTGMRGFRVQVCEKDDPEKDPLA